MEGKEWSERAEARGSAPTMLHWVQGQPGISARLTRVHSAPTQAFTQRDLRRESHGGVAVLCLSSHAEALACLSHLLQHAIAHADPGIKEPRVCNSHTRNRMIFPSQRQSEHASLAQTAGARNRHKDVQNNRLKPQRFRLYNQRNI